MKSHKDGVGTGGEAGAPDNKVRRGVGKDPRGVFLNEIELKGLSSAAEEQTKLRKIRKLHL